MNWKRFLTQLYRNLFADPFVFWWYSVFSVVFSVLVVTMSAVAVDISGGNVVALVLSVLFSLLSGYYQSRPFRVVVAHIRLFIYLTIFGIFKGECAFTGFDASGRAVYIAATTGSIFDGTIRARRVFFDETKNADS